MQITYLAKRWGHHTTSGGYDRLASQLGAHVVRRYQRTAPWHRVARFGWRKTTRTKEYLSDYQYEDLLAEGRVLIESWLRRPQLVHVLYGDEQLDVLLRFRRWLPCPLVASFHLPVNQVKDRFERIQKTLVRGIDLAVVVSTCQLPDFRHWLGADRVAYVPHGIDTERFCPGSRRSDESRLQIVFVGSHMRDWSALQQIVAQCRARELPIQFDFVIEQSAFRFFVDCHDARLHTNVSEDRLIAFYRQADALLMPVTDATANNSVLEALACGTPVISNTIGGIPDYLDDSCGWLFQKGEVEEIVQLLKDCCADRTIADSRREAARRKAASFSWNRIAAQMESVYAAVIQKA